MGNHMTTRTFIMQRLCTASLFMDDKTDWWVEYHAWAGVDTGLKDK